MLSPNPGCPSSPCAYPDRRSPRPPGGSARAFPLVVVPTQFGITGWAAKAEPAGARVPLTTRAQPIHTRRRDLVAAPERPRFCPSPGDPPSREPCCSDVTMCASFGGGTSGAGPVFTIISAAGIAPVSAVVQRALPATGSGRSDGVSRGRLRREGRLGERPAGAEGGLELARVEGLGEQVALPEATSESLEERELVGTLDALRDGVDLQHVAELHDRRRESGVLVGGADPVHERLVDLQDVDREPAEVAERGVPRPEVVDG